MLTAGAGRILSPFGNDPFALVAQAFNNLYPERVYLAQIAPDVVDDDGNTAYGVTTFPNDGTPPLVEVSENISIEHAVEIFAHELAHVATPEDGNHGEAWRTAFDRIFEEYNRIGEALRGKNMCDEKKSKIPNLKPCRYCGGRAKIMKKRVSYFEPRPLIMCMSCRLTTREFETVEEAVTYWNT